jgi:hypothetical protein
MADYRHERSASSKRKLELPKKKPVDLGLPAPRAPRRSNRRRERELAALLRDFRLGLTSLRSLTSRLQTTKPDYRAQTHAPEPAMSPAITKIVERERRIVERTLMTLPAKEREVLMRSYTTQLQSVMSAQAPQAYAAILKGAQIIQPAKVLRPNQPYVQELMATAKAIRSGRAAFIPQEIKAKARKLLMALFGRQQAVSMLTAKDLTTNSLIRQYRLIPQSIRAAVSAKPVKTMTRVERELQTVLKRVVQYRTSTQQNSQVAHSGVQAAPIAHAEMAELAPALPAMHTGGAAISPAGGETGEYRMRVGEEAHVITQNASLLSAAEAPEKAAQSKRPEQSKKPAPAPPPADSKTPSPSESTHKPATSYDSPSGSGRAEDSGMTARPDKTIKVEDIDGLSDWVADTERRLSELS